MRGPFHFGPFLLNAVAMETAMTAIAIKIRLYVIAYPLSQMCRRVACTYSNSFQTSFTLYKRQF